MAVEQIFMVAGAIIFLGFFGELIFKKTRIPDVIWLILIGIALNQYLNWVSPSDFGALVPIFITFTLVFILFEGALHIRFKDLLRDMLPATSLTLLNFIFSIAIVTYVVVVFGIGSWIHGLLLGTILGGTSSAVVIPMIKRLKMSKDTQLILTLESAFSDVICIVAALALIEALTFGSIAESASGPQLSVLLNQLLGSFAIAVFVGGLLGVIWVLLLEKFRSLERYYMTTVAFLLVLYGFMEYIGASGAIAALSFGIILGNSAKILEINDKYSIETLSISAKTFFSQISFFVKTLFFVYIGILIDFSNLFVIFLAAIITLAIFSIRPLPVFLAASSASPKDKAIMESMIPKGLAAAVLAQLPAQAGIPGTAAFANIVFLVIFFTVVLGTILSFAIQFNLYNGTTSIYHWLFGGLTHIFMRSPPEHSPLMHTQEQTAILKSGRQH